MLQYKIRKKKISVVGFMLRLQCSKNISSDALLLLGLGTVRKAAPLRVRDVN